MTILKLYFTILIGSGAFCEHPGLDHDDGSHESQAGDSEHD